MYKLSIIVVVSFLLMTIAHCAIKYGLAIVLVCVFNGAFPYMQMDVATIITHYTMPTHITM